MHRDKALFRVGFGVARGGYKRHEKRGNEGARTYRPASLSSATCRGGKGFSLEHRTLQKLGLKFSKAAPARVAHLDESEGRWFGEGGNTQTRTARPAYRRL
ncbi:MAG: hypothetical protein EPO20_13045 [Betaproteobacteria bacterium]|nr:MAG: hypothetical protein EPO20_13045 [Betaproteobacteria bacterium]